MTTSKECRGCGLDKMVSEYHKDKYASDGIKTRCKPCCIKAVLSHQASNKDHYKKYRDTFKSSYNRQKNTAKARGVGFNISFDQWLWFWNGHWDKRGRVKEGLVMCRNKDTGPYELGNIYLDTLSNNMKYRHELTGAKKDG